MMSEIINHVSVWIFGLTMICFVYYLIMPRKDEIRDLIENATRIKHIEHNIYQQAYIIDGKFTVDINRYVSLKVMNYKSNFIPEERICDYMELIKKRFIELNRIHRPLHSQYGSAFDSPTTTQIEILRKQEEVLAKYKEKEGKKNGWF